MGRISDQERLRRLNDLQAYEEDGLGVSEIAEKTGMSIMAIKRLKAYREGLMKADLTPEDLSEKRGEFFLEFTEASVEAKDLFLMYKLPVECPLCKGTCIVKVKEVEKLCRSCKGLGYLHNTSDAVKFLKVWVEIIEKKASLFGLDNVKFDVLNQQFNFGKELYSAPIKLSGEALRMSERLAKRIIVDHEDGKKAELEDG